MAFLVLLLAVLSRVLPLLLHTTGGNVTMVGAGLLYFGANVKPERRWMALIAVAALAATDWWLTAVGYGYPFHPLGYLPTWLWYGAVCLLASAALQKRHGMLRVAVAALATSSSFFFLSNGLVWLRGNMYPHTGAGLAECYAAGLPFYRNDLASTLLFSAVFFLLPSTAAIKQMFAGNDHDAAAA